MGQVPETKYPHSIEVGKGMPHRDLHISSFLINFDIDEAAQVILQRMYKGTMIPEEPINHQTRKKLERNEEIMSRYARGETVRELATFYRISEQRIHQILKGARN
jgi:hypothetical protein